MKKTLTFEGFLVNDSGWEFEAPLYLIKPIIQMRAVGNIGEAEHIVEDYMINLSLGDENKSDVGHYATKKWVLESFEKAKKKKGQFTYWKKVIEYNETELKSDEFDYDIVDE